MTTNPQQVRDELHAKKRDISTAIKDKIAKIREHRESRDKLTQFVHDGKKQRNDLNDKIKVYIDQLKVQQPAESQSKPSAPRSTVPIGKLMQEVKQLQKKIETEALPFDKEKQLMKVYKEKKKELEAIKESQSSSKNVGKLGRELSKLKKEADAIHAKVQQAAEQSQKEHEQLLILSKEIDTLKEDEKSVLSQLESVKDELRKLGIDTKRVDKQKTEQLQKKTVEKVEKHAEEAQAKMKLGKKLTTEDFLAMQSKAAWDDKDGKTKNSDEKDE